MGCGASKAPSSPAAPPPPAKAPSAEFNPKWEQAGQLFDMWDDNRNGTLETAEQMRVFQFFQEQGDVSFDTLLESLAEKDADGSTNTKQDRAEFATWLAKVMSSLDQTAQDKMFGKLMLFLQSEQLFKLWDENGNGYLETAEQTKVFKFFQEQGEVSFDVLLNSLADTDVDGSANTKQDKTEFATWLLKVTGSLDAGSYATLLTKLPLVTAYLAADRLFTRWDANGNGFLETAEQLKVFKFFQEQGDVDFDVLLESLAEKDADGSTNTKQDKTEFVTWLLKVLGTKCGVDRAALTDKITLYLKAEQLFDLWDTNGNGYLETAEQQKVFKFFQEQGDVSFDILLESLAEKDEDGSTNTKQDKTEFVTWLFKVTSALPPSKTGELFEKLKAKLGQTNA